jgi:hypothetical protein
MSKKSEQKNRVVTVRLSESEYVEILLKISDVDGNLIVPVSTYLRAATAGVSVTATDRDVERAKIHLYSKASNNINQIAKQINTQAKINHYLSDDDLNIAISELKKVNQIFSLIRK